MNKVRPRGWNNKPIPKGMLYSDYTKEEIDAKIAAADAGEILNLLTIEVNRLGGMRKAYEILREIK